MESHDKRSKIYITFTMRRDTCPSVTLNNKVLPQKDNVKYFGIHLDQRLTWKKHIWMKRKQLRLKLHKMYWLLGRKSKLLLENKVLLYKTILKRVWTYGIQLWGTASNSNIEILNDPIESPNSERPMVCSERSDTKRPQNNFGEGRN